MTPTAWAPRSLATDVSAIEGVPSTFSSWDKCMSKPYCKWPAIIGIVIGCLFAISMIWCLIRCCSCCGSCCGGCCGGRGRSGRRNADQGPPQGAYAGFNGGYQPAPQHPTYEPPRFAQFDVSKTGGAGVHEDSLPAMPSWETAQQRKVLEEHAAQNDVEMGHLDPATGQNDSTLDPSAQHPYQEVGQPARVASPYAASTAYSDNHHSPPAYGSSVATELPAAAPEHQPYNGAYAGQGYGHASPLPTQPYNQGGQSYGHTSPPPAQPYSQGGYRGATSPPPTGYTAYSPTTQNASVPRALRPTAPAGSAPPSRQRSQEQWTVV